MLVTLVFSWMYVVTDAPPYNPVGTIDPWLYTALWTNFDQIYDHFVGTYYASRIPWIVPGYALNLLFDHRTAYFIIYIAFFFVGAILLYVVCRRWFGAIAALVAYIGLMKSAVLQRPPLGLRGRRSNHLRDREHCFCASEDKVGAP